MSVSVVNIGTAHATSGTTVTVTVGAGGVPAGVVIIIVCGYNNVHPNTGGTISDTAGNSYFGGALDGAYGVSASNTCMVFFTHLTSAALSSGNVITWTMDQSSGTRGAMSVFYATGLVGPPENIGVFSIGTSATPSSGLNNNLHVGDLVVGLVGIVGSSGTFTQDSTNGPYATPPNESTTGTSNSDFRVDGGTMIATAVTHQTYAPTYSNGKSWVCGIIIFQAAPQTMGWIPIYPDIVDPPVAAIGL